MLSCSIWFSAPSFWMGGGLERRCVDRVYGADGTVRRHGTIRTIHTIRCGDRIPVGERFTAPVQNSPEAHSSTYRTGMAAGVWRWLPNPSSGEVKGRLEPYHYSPSGPSWPVRG